MANIKLLVSGLGSYTAQVNAAMPRIAEAYAPFGINLVLEPGLLLTADPGDTPSGWQRLLEKLTAISDKAGTERPAHMVFTALPFSRNRSINGELKLKRRGVSAVYLEADSLQNIDAQERINRIAEVGIHEMGHLLNMIHSDGFNKAAHVCSMMPSQERHLQTPADAWAMAIQDAAARSEPPLKIPVPATYYPFAAQCRAILREAAVNRAWWPWENDFRASFDSPSEVQDASLFFDLPVLEKSTRRQSLSSRFAGAVDNKLNQTLNFMEDGWKPL